MTEMQKIEKYGRWELNCPSGTKNVTITAPDGSTCRKETFLRTPGKLIRDYHGYETCIPDGAPCACVRYTPTECGVYTYTADTGLTGSFEVYDGGKHGYVGVGKKDSRYFAFTDGTPFPVIGLNLASLTEYSQSNAQEFGITGGRVYLGTAEYARWFRKLSQAGGNHARIWLGQEYLRVDTEDAEKLNLLQFEKLDRIIELARQYGIYLKLTFDHFRFFGKSRYDDVYDPRCKRLFGKQLFCQGEACTSMTQWLRGEKWRNAWIAKVKQYLLRYGGDPIVMVFELWNEMNAVEADYEDVLQWNRDMAKRLRPMAPENMWSQSIGSMDSVPNKELYTRFHFEDFSFSQFHRYLDQGAPLEECRSDGFVFTKSGIAHARREGMPVLLAETGSVNDCHSGPMRYYMSDDRGVIFADTVLPAFFLGAAGCGQIWHWGIYVENKMLFPMLRPLADALEGVMLEEEDFISEDLSTDKAWIAVLRGKHTILGFVRNRSDSWYATLRDDIEPELVPDFLIPAAEGQTECYPIWRDETAVLTRQGEKLLCRGLHYGFLYRVQKST